MSRKRKQSKRATDPAPVEAEAVPEEILAEGSGPVEDVEDVDAGKLAEAAKAVGRRGQKRRAPVQEQEASTEAAPSDQSDEVSADEDGTSNGADVEAAGDSGDARPRRRRRGRVAGDGSSNGAAVEAAAMAEAVAEDELRADGDAGVETADDDAAAELEAAGGAADAESVGLEAAGDESAEDGASVEALASDESRVVDDEVADDGDAAELGAVLPTSAASMDAVQLKHLVEALVFASDKPLTLVRLRQLTRVNDTKRLEQALADIAEDFRERGIVLQQVSGGYQFRTRTQFSSWVQQLIAGRPVRLSHAQLETLAIIAYRQPITRPEIDDIRGVDSSATLKLLIDRQLIRILGKREEVGRPMLYGTTKEFLDFFSLGDLRELPTLREYSELTDESRQVMSARLGIDLDDTARAPSDGGGDDEGGGDGGGGSGGDGSGGNGGGGFIPDDFDPGHAPGVESPVEASEAHVGAVEIEDAGVQDEAASHVGLSSEVDVQEIEARDAVADSAVTEGLEWPEGSGRVGEASEAGIGPAIAFAPAPEVIATDDVDAAEVADPALVAEQRTTQSAHDSTPE